MSTNRPEPWYIENNFTPNGKQQLLTLWKRDEILHDIDPERRRNQEVVRPFVK